LLDSKIESVARSDPFQHFETVTEKLDEMWAGRPDYPRLFEIRNFCEKKLFGYDNNWIWIVPYRGSRTSSSQTSDTLSLFNWL